MPLPKEMEKLMAERPLPMSKVYTGLWGILFAFFSPEFRKALSAFRGISRSLGAEGSEGVGILLRQALSKPVSFLKEFSRS